MIRSPIMDVPDPNEMDIYLTSNEIRTSQLDVYLGNLDIQHICPTITLNLEEHIKKEIKEEVLEEDSNSSSLVLEHSSDDDMKVHFCCHLFISTPPTTTSSFIKLLYSLTVMLFNF